ncbi:hypothetical protein TruAng_008427 [Truncatella angustata]|nr:hypothetical protein TruAng_008427 [Truncatella angustata]
MAVVESQMAYLEPWLDKPEGPYVRGKVEESFPRQNFANVDYKVKVHDARARKDEFNLDTHGFAFHDDEPLSDEIVEAIRTRSKLFVEQQYYPLVAKLVKKKTGANRVVIFDHTYRKRDPSLAANENPNGREQPATLVHCDQSAIGAVGRVKRHVPGDTEELLKGRAQVINLKASDIHPTSIFRERHEMQGQTVSINYSPDQQWHYLDRQKTSEVTFIKIWDNSDDVAKLCAHCAFPHPDAVPGAQPRESVEFEWSY